MSTLESLYFSERINPNLLKTRFIAHMISVVKEAWSYAHCDWSDVVSLCIRFSVSILDRKTPCLNLLKRVSEIRIELLCIVHSSTFSINYSIVSVIYQVWGFIFHVSIIDHFSSIAITHWYISSHTLLSIFIRIIVVRPRVCISWLMNFQRNSARA